MRGSVAWKVLAVGAAFSALTVAGCGGSGGGGNNSGGNSSSGSGGAEMASRITGAGSSFDAPLFGKAFQQMAKNGGPQVNYQPVGSGAGIEQFTNKTADFGASDAPMSDADMKKAGGNPLHIAVTAGPAVAAYNVKGVSKLNLSGQVLADIFQGNIKKWNDRAIKKLNPDASLPSSNITVVHRSDSSGTTNIFTSYLAAVSSKWKSALGAGETVKWPVGVGGDGNDGVASQIQQNQNSIGYVGFDYAAENNIATAAIGTQSAGFTEPSPEAASKAIAKVKIPDDLRVTVSSEAPTGKGVYPITGLSWMLVRQQQDDLAKCKAVAKTAWYITHDGQQFSNKLHYAKVPDPVVKIDEKFIKSMKAKGKSCYSG